jgi:hypothetical protein
MLNFTGKGKPIAKVISGSDSNEILYLDPDDKSKSSESDSSESYSEESESDRGQLGTEYVSDGKLIEILNPNERNISYVCGPSGSGKTTHSIELIKSFKKIFPKRDFYLFSRTDYKNDPAYKGIKVNQVLIDESLIDNPIDIEQDIPPGSILLFDDCNTIQNDKIKKSIDKLIADILEVGRKLNLMIKK